MTNTATARYTLAAGLAFVLVVFGIDKFLHPLVWIGWIPKSFDGLIGMSQGTWLRLIGTVEVFLGVLVIVPKALVQKIASVLIALHLVAILTQTGWNDIAVRDIGLLFMTIGLFYLL